MLIIAANIPSTIPVDDPSSITQILQSGEWSTEDATVRVCLRDEQGFGIQVPASLSENLDTVTFFLPEQLNVFDPALTYFLAVEVILPGALLVPSNLTVQIAPGASLGAEKFQDDLDPVQNFPGTPEPPDAFLDEALAIVAPMPEQEVGKPLRLEDISAEVIEEALWKRKEAQPAVLPASAPPSQKNVALKNAVKKLLMA